jgi:diadenosine tetraphosphate (Ap4A) HIT family hydrolase
MFELHPQLAADCEWIGDLSLNRVLLVNDKNYPWLILVPMRENIREIFQLTEADQCQLLIESSAVSKLMYEHFKAEKMNVAALGNMVPQLHIHHVARYKDDIAWPGPVWGAASAIFYTEDEMQAQVSLMRDLLRVKGLL